MTTNTNPYIEYNFADLNAVFFNWKHDDSQPNNTPQGSV